MRYVSLFSGIEAASVAWEPLGWEPMAFAEIEEFPCAVLAERFPEVPNLGDVTKIDWGEFIENRRRPDVVVGGSPCQAFSVAGRRAGLEDARGRLMFEFVRAVRELDPRWVLWENVPGVLSQDEGRAFGTLVGELDDLGHRLAWRVLDAQFFGVAQRRRRVFLVGSLGDFRCAAALLLEPHCLRWGSPSSREKRKALAARVGCGVEGADGGCLNPADVQSTRIYEPPGIAPTLMAQHGRGAQPPNVFAPAIAIRLSNSGANGSGISDTAHTLDCRGPEAVAYGFKYHAGSGAGNNVLETNNRGSGKTSYIVRRLTPKEAERLQGFPDDWTCIPWRGKPAEECPDGPRYKAIGNSMAVPVMRWIGERMQMADAAMRKE